MAGKIEGSDTDDSNIEQINNNILNEDVNEEYGVLEEESTFKRTASEDLDDVGGKDYSTNKSSSSSSRKLPTSQELIDSTDSQDTSLQHDSADNLIDDLADDSNDDSTSEKKSDIKNVHDKNPKDSNDSRNDLTGVPKKGAISKFSGKKNISTSGLYSKNPKYSKDYKNSKKFENKNTIKPAAKTAVKPSLKTESKTAIKTVSKPVLKPVLRNVSKPSTKFNKNVNTGNGGKTNEKNGSNGNNANGNKANVKNSSYASSRYVSKTESRVEKMKNKSKKKNHLWIWILFGVILVVLILVLVFALKSINPKSGPKGDGTIAATVNGENIYQSEIDSKYNGLNPILQGIYTKELILNQTIDELLLLQHAKKLGMKIPSSEIDSELADFKSSNGITDAQLEEILAKQNMTIKELRSLIEKKLLIRDLLNETILKNILINDSEIESYYNTNKDSFVSPEEVKAAHILVGNIERSDEEALNLINQVKSKVNDTNFCELAKEYSEDPGSKDKCGEYTFARNVMVKEFEDMAFGLKNGEMDIAKTNFGYHLIKKIESYPAVQTPIEDAYEEIKQALHDEKAQTNFDSLLQSLRDAASIIKYENKAEEDLVPEITSSDDILKVTSSGSESDSKNVQKGLEPTSVSEANLDVFAKCLTEKGAKMYGAYWCPHCENNKKLFGESLKYVTYVECAVDGQPQVQTQVCTDVGITGYPTWIVDGKKYPGEQSLEKLATLSGCAI